MKPLSLVLIVIGAFATLWGAYALVMAFNGYTPDTSYLGKGKLYGPAIRYTYDEEGNRSPTDAEVQAILAADQAEYDVLIKQHKTRGGLVLGGGVVLLASGIVLARKKTKR